MTIPAIQKVSVPVHDQQKARDFYTNALGLKLLADRPMGGEGARWIEVGGETGANLILVTWFPVAPGSLQGLVVTTPNVDEVCARLRDAGVEVGGPVDEAWGRQATCADPDGNGLVLLQG
jgi:catechol 2,3-dioxygenase-like lactoylglutathione lyase family enzyme